MKNQALLDHYSEQGYYVARGLVEQHEVEEIRAVFQTLANDGPIPGLQDSSRLRVGEPLARYPRMMHPHRFPELPVGPMALKYMLDPRIERMLHALMGEEPIASQSMFYFKPPGSRGQGFHQDNFYLRVRPGTCMAAWIAIDDADSENGGLVIVPGTHSMDIVCPERADHEQFFTTEQVPIPDGLHEMPLTLKAGDVLFFNGSLVHGSYPNRSADRFRRALICHYIPASCREAAGFYHPLLRFDGRAVDHIGTSAGGGPCGTEGRERGVSALPMWRHGTLRANDSSNRRQLEE